MPSVKMYPTGYGNVFDNWRMPQKLFALSCRAKSHDVPQCYQKLCPSNSAIRMVGYSILTKKIDLYYPQNRWISLWIKSGIRA